jgi:hypothetical protein
VGTITAIVAHGLFASLARAIERRHHRHHVQKPEKAQLSPEGQRELEIYNAST